MCAAATLQRICNTSYFGSVSDKCALHRGLHIWLPHAQDSGHNHHTFFKNGKYCSPVACQYNPLSKIPHEQRKKLDPPMPWGANGKMG